ncbi:flavodoxin family protein [Alistipes putredinis]|uniref:flavodoxin family protein n=1 Tax=Alistipes putredinis TaxID=28117 RepID=UPI0039913AC8
MKKVYAINGSPRRNRNTATLLDKVLEGCRDAFPGMVETERINLGDLHYTGCKSCFACKLKDGPSYGTCALRDDIRPCWKRYGLPMPSCSVPPSITIP